MAAEDWREARSLPVQLALTSQEHREKCMAEMREAIALGKQAIKDREQKSTR